jgi:hypothetical protein
MSFKCVVILIFHADFMLWGQGFINLAFCLPGEKTTIIWCLHTPPGQVRRAMARWRWVGQCSRKVLACFLFVFVSFGLFYVWPKCTVILLIFLAKFRWNTLGKCRHFPCPSWEKPQLLHVHVWYCLPMLK